MLLTGTGSATLLEAERGEVSLVDGLVDLAADAGGEELRLGEVVERCRRCRVTQEIGLECLVGGVAPRPGESRRDAELAVVGRIVEVGQVAIRRGSERVPVEEVVENVG